MENFTTFLFSGNAYENNFLFYFELKNYHISMVNFTLFSESIFKTIKRKVHYFTVK